MKKIIAKLVLFGIIATALSLGLNAYAKSTTPTPAPAPEPKSYPICIDDDEGMICYPDEWCETHFEKKCSEVTKDAVKAEVECMQGAFGDISGENCEELSKAQSNNYSSALNDAKAAPCIQEKLYNDGTVTDTPGPDANYIITILEEPLTLKKSITTTAQEDPFESRICFRNSFSFTTGDRREHTITELSTKCSEDAKKFLTGEEHKKRNTKFGCQPIQVLLSKGGTSLIKGYISLIYKWAASIVGLIAVVVIIYSGLQISLAGGETEAINDGKKRIVQSLAGIALLFLSGLILNAVNPNFFV